METKKKETETELVQLVRQLRDYVILDRKDYEAMSSDESYIVEKGEIDSTPTMQNALKPKKQKTVTEIIHDQLGPGYVPRGHKGGRQILVKEVECKDYAQDDSNRVK